MDTVADDIISGWCDLDPKTRYRVAAAVVRLFERPNDKAPYEWASLTRQLLLKAPDPDAVFNEIVDRLHPTSWSGSLTTELEARLTLLDQFDINAVPELAAALDATKATLKDRTELVLRVIHTIHQAMTHHRSYQIRYTGESRCPPQKWIPAFAGKARRGRRAASTE